MALHRLTRLTIGVPNVDETAAFYADFGLIPIETADGEAVRRFATVDGGEQLNLVHRPIRQLVEIGIGAGDADDLGRIKAALSRIDIDAPVNDDELRAVEPATGIAVTVSVVPELAQKFVQAEQNFPGDIRRPSVRAPALYRDEPVRPKKLGHVVFGSTDYAASKRFFMDGLGFKISDEVADIGAFMRCSPDHHNVLVQAAPVNFLHHTSWEVEDFDEIGRGAHTMLEDHRSAMYGESAGTGSGQTSSTIFVTRPATCRSTTPTWTRYSTTRSGIPASGAPTRSPIIGDRPCHRR